MTRTTITTAAAFAALATAATAPTAHASVGWIAVANSPGHEKLDWGSTR